MSSMELKSKFHHLIEHIQDERMLRDLYDCVAMFSLQNDTQDILEQAQIERLKSSLTQIKEETLIDNETIKRKVKQWITK